jgi:hypothetical protein
VVNKENRMMQRLIILALVVFGLLGSVIEVRATEGEFSNVVLKVGQHTLKEKYDVFSKGNKEY